VKIVTPTLNTEQIESILFRNEAIDLDKAIIEHVQASFLFLQKFSEGKVIYGINTGFGPMARFRISDDLRSQLQYNLIRSHCTGTGSLLPCLYVKSIMLARLNTLLQGHSGVHSEVVSTLTEWINHDIYPLVFEHGGVGASGDLVQLAHIALGLIGEGEVIYKGERLSARQVIKQLELNPVKMHIREGIALTNGTSAMTGIGWINFLYAKKLINWTILASCLLNEIVSSFDDYFSFELNRTKLHPGQQSVAEKMRLLLSGSKRIRNRADYLYKPDKKDNNIHDNVQECYSLRCVPQILGPVEDEINHTETLLIHEINSVSDNPVVDHINGNVFHGGNFHGDYVAFQMDKLKIAITKLTILAERQMNFLFNDKINNLLPPFVNLGTKGLNFGLQGAQFTATSTTAESQTLSNPMSIHSIPNNNDNQDVVSMGTNAALITKTVIENAFHVLSIHFMAIMQAIDYLQIYEELSPKGKDIYSEIRSFFPVFVEDSPIYKDIERMNQYLKEKIL